MYCCVVMLFSLILGFLFASSKFVIFRVSQVTFLTIEWISSSEFL